MKSKTFKEFFDNFKQQSTCLICGNPIYIKTISKYDGSHIAKTCYKHTYYLLTYSIESNKDVLLFDDNGCLVLLNKQKFSSLKLEDIIKIYDEKSFMSFVQNLKVLL